MNYLAPVVGLLLSGTLLADTGEPGEELRRNPFAVPAALVAAPAPAAAAQSRGAAGAPVPAPEPEPDFTLHAVLHAGKHSLANIDGNIVGLGERVEGYRLARIGDYEVVLIRGARRVVLNLHGDDTPGRRR